MNFQQIVGAMVVVVMFVSPVFAAKPSGLLVRVNEALLPHKVRVSLQEDQRRLLIEHGTAFRPSVFANRRGSRVELRNVVGQTSKLSAVAILRIRPKTAAAELLGVVDGQERAKLVLPVGNDPAFIVGRHLRTEGSKVLGIERWRFSNPLVLAVLRHFQETGPRRVLAGTHLLVSESMRQPGAVLAEVDGELKDLTGFDVATLNGQQREVLVRELLTQSGTFRQMSEDRTQFDLPAAHRLRERMGIQGSFEGLKSTLRSQSQLFNTTAARLQAQYERAPVSVGAAQE